MKTRMGYVESILDGVQRAITEGRIGTAVFARCMVSQASRPEDRAAMLGVLMESAGRFFGTTPHCVYARGDMGAGCLVVGLEFPSGAFAHVSVAADELEPKLDLTILGNQGAIYHDSAIPSGEPVGLQSVPKSDTLGTLLAAVRQSLDDGQPVTVGDTVGPPASEDDTVLLGSPVFADQKTKVILLSDPSKPSDWSARHRVPHHSHARYGVLLVSGRMTHQEMYGPAFAADPRCRLVAVTDEPDVPEERRMLNEQLADDFQIPYLPVLDEALARDDVHLVSVCAEPERRARVVARCAQAGKAVYIDKPMTPYLKGAADVVAAVAETGVPTQVFSFIHQPWAQRAQRIVESGQLGDLVAVHAECLFAKGPSGTALLGGPRREHPAPERFTFTECKRELYAMGYYAIVLARWLAGAEARRVYATTANYFFREHQQHDVEDFGWIAMEMENGVTATITGARAGWNCHPAGGANQVFLIGTRGMLKVDAWQPRLEICDNEAPWNPPALNPRDPMGCWVTTQEEVNVEPKRAWRPISIDGQPRADESFFIDCLDAGRDGQFNARGGAAVAEITIAAYRAGAEKRVVELLLPRQWL